eukprot:maker-scaffold469_size162558-snap-gene-0.29 protein:Tk06424 transcript:maker-scaffold469_size162558-snap-gene-0.29-mRNA-1 annotation:"cdk5 and abl1 enzyme substrate 1 isoform x2"
MVLSASARSLDLSRRRVAAITFLANIQVQGDREGDQLDGNQITEIRLDCLQNTHVLRDFQDNKRMRHERSACLNSTMRPNRESLSSELGGEPERIARKLTFGQSENMLFVEEREEEVYNSNKHLVHIEEHDEPRTPNLRSAKGGLENNENLLHLDLSNVQGAQAAPRSAPAGVVIANANQSLTSKDSRLSFNFAHDRNNSHEQLPESRNLFVSKRKITHYSKPEELRSFNIGSSNESLSFIPSNLGARLRKISGNLSENSSTSNRDVRLFRSDDDKPCANERLLLVSPERKTPFAVVSIIPYNKSRPPNRNDKEYAKRARTNSGARQFSLLADEAHDLMHADKIDDTQETSYSHLLNPTSSEEIVRREALMVAGKRGGSRLSRIHESRNSRSETDQAVRGSISSGYSPHELDGWLIAGKHRTFLPFPSYVTSIIEYVKPSELKKDLNSKFKERFPNLQLSLSKLRSIKKEMKRVVVVECNLDLLTVALAYVYFEILVLKNNINKVNRKFCAGSCIILAAKMNDVKKADLSMLIEKIESAFRINRKDLLTTEFAVLVTLEFGLHIPSWQIFPHYQRLLYET